MGADMRNIFIQKVTQAIELMVLEPAVTLTLTLNQS